MNEVEGDEQGGERRGEFSWHDTSTRTSCMTSRATWPKSGWDRLSSFFPLPASSKLEMCVPSERMPQLLGEGPARYPIARSSVSGR